VKIRAMEFQEKYETLLKAAQELYDTMKDKDEYAIFEYWNKLGEVLDNIKESP
jgi:hypothetical protein